MSPQLYSAILNPRGPNYERLKDCFPENRVPLKSAQSIKAQLGPEKDVSVYMLDLAAMPSNQRARLLSMVASKCGALISEVEQVAATNGFPIREDDLIVSFDMRAFV